MQGSHDVEDLMPQETRLGERRIRNGCAGCMLNCPCIVRCHFCAVWRPSPANDSVSSKVSKVGMNMGSTLQPPGSPYIMAVHLWTDWTESSHIADKTFLHCTGPSLAGNSLSPSNGKGSDRNKPEAQQSSCASALASALASLTLSRGSRITVTACTVDPCRMWV